MAQKIYNSVVYWRKSGIGILPGIVIKTRLEQQLDGTLAEVLTLLYAHPDDEGTAHHQANDVGDVAFSVYPLRDKTDTLPAVSFGWADTLEAFNAPKPRPTIAELEAILNSEENYDVKINPDGSITAVSVPPVAVDTNPAGAVVPAPVVVYPSGVGSTPESRAEYEVFADPEGRTIGTRDEDGGYENIRDNPFPPESGSDWMGKPIK